MSLLPLALHIRSISILAVALGLGGCVSTQVTSLRDASAFEAKVPASDFRHVDEGSSLRVAKIVTLKRGVYRPAGQDENGVWYVGPPENLSLFYTERKRSDGKRLLEVYTGGVYVPHAGKSGARVFLQPNTVKMLLVSDSNATETPPKARLPGETLAESYQMSSEIARGGATTGATIAGSAIGGAVADALLIHDAKGFRLMPGLDDVAAWFDGR